MSDQAGSTAVATRKASARDLRVGAVGPAFANMGEVVQFANLMSTAGEAIPPQFRENPGGCLAVIMDSINFGIHPFALARQAYFVNGVLAYMAQAINAIIISRAPIKARPRYAYKGEGPELQCVVTVETVDGTVISHPSPKIKDIKVKNSPLWVTDPMQQLGYYTVRSMARLHFPDILMGVYDPAEAETFRRETEMQIERRNTIADRLPGATAEGSGMIDGNAIDQETRGGRVAGFPAGVAEAVGEALAAIAEDAASDTVASAAMSTQELEEARVKADAGDAGVPENDYPLVIEIWRALENTASLKELEAAWSEFEGALENVDRATQDHAANMISVYRKQYTVAEKPKGGKKSATLL